MILRNFRCHGPRMAAFLLLAGAAMAGPPQVLRSNRLAVAIDPLFPRVLGYSWRANGAVLHGQGHTIHTVKLNGEPHTPRVTFARGGESRAGYTLDFPDIQVRVFVGLEVADHILHLRITRIDEPGRFKVRTIEFPDHQLVSIRGSQPGAALATARMAGEWSKLDEEFAPLAGRAPDAQPVNRTYAVLHTDRLAASLDNNVIEYERLRAQTTQLGGDPIYGIWNAPWTYRGPDGTITGLPWAKVIISDDRNADGRVDWQDGAIGFRESMAQPKGAEIIRDSFSYISFNGGSIAIAPFLRALEDAKQLSLMTDGFGQMVQLKGYQSEGHDAAHPDCAGNYNRRAGGWADLRTFLQYAPEYRIYPGVHINVSESYPEAKNFSDAILRVPHEAGWAWYDRSLKMDYLKDIQSGSLARRLDLMRDELPGLRWVYVDVYGGHYGNNAWAAHTLASKLNDNGWLVGTEYLGPMERPVLWVHHLYAVPDSRLVRFIRNHVADTFKSHPLLKGAKPVGIGGWENNYNFNEVVKTFYLDNLPTKYLQHFPITRWSDQRIDFEGGVHVEGGDGWKLFRNGKQLSDGYSMFIPWNPITEDKIYYWSTATETRYWAVPDSWSDRKTLKLYRLTRRGREFVRDLDVADGQVGLLTEPHTPYVIYPAEPQPVRIVWGEGGPVRNPGFTSGTFDAWERASGSDPLSIEADGNANALLAVNAGGRNGAAAAVRQRITGLQAGRTYSASVWVNVTGGRRAWIQVDAPGIPAIRNWVDRTDHRRSEGRLKFKDTTFQRLAVTFDVPPGSPDIMLSLGAGAGAPESAAWFDDVRVVELPGRTPRGSRLIFEDFENVDEQWGPFVSAGGTDHVHLSETNPGVTDDTIHGNFSLKNLNEGTRGEIYRTVQATLKLEPNTRYRVGFAYIHRNANFHVAVKTKDGGDAGTALDAAIPDGEGEFTSEFTTGNFTDYYVSFQTETSHGRMFVIDDFFIESL